MLESGRKVQKKMEVHYLNKSVLECQIAKRSYKHGILLSEVLEWTLKINGYLLKGSAIQR